MAKWAPFLDIRGSHLGAVDMFLEAWLDRVIRGEIDTWISGINRWGCLDCFEEWLRFCGKLEAWGYFGLSFIMLLMGNRSLACFFAVI